MNLTFRNFSLIFFLAFIFFRPSLDVLADKKILGNFNINFIIIPLLIIICGIFILINRNNIKKNRFLYNFNKIYIVFLITVAFSFINTKSYIDSLSEYLKLITIIVVFNYVSVFFDNNIRSISLIYTIIFSSIFPLLIGFNQFLFKTGSKITPGFNRIYGTFTHPNPFANFLLGIYFLILFVITTLKIKLYKKLILFLILCFILFEIYNTYARIAWVSLFIGTIILVLFRTNMKKKIIYINLGVLFFLIAFPLIIVRWNDILQKGIFEESYVSSLNWRINLWTRIIESNIVNKSFFGNGLGMFNYIIGVEAHNDYLRLWYEVGFLGLFTYLLLLFYIFFISLKKLLKAKSILDINRNKILFCIVFSIVIMSVVGNIITGLVVLLYYFSIMALLFNNNIFQEYI